VQAIITNLLLSCAEARKTWIFTQFEGHSGKSKMKLGEERRSLIPSALRLAAIALAGAALALAKPAWTQAQSLDAQIEPVRVKYGLPALAAAVVKKGEIVAAGAVGVRVYGTDIPVTIDDRFHLGSDTKAMTATLAGILVDDRKLRWTSTVGEVLGANLPDMNQKLATVTLEQLLSHSSGIPSDTKEMIAIYFNTDAFDYNLAALRLRALAAWRHNEPKEPQGSPFQYSNFGYIIAGAMIEKAAGVPWEQLMVERIFAPLGLRTAGLGAQATLGKLDAPVGHQIDEQGNITPILWGAAADAPPMIGPAGTAHMSILDFARWAGWNAGEGRRGPTIVTPQTIKFIHAPQVKTPRIENPKPGTPQTGEYAFGWGVVKFDWTQKPVLSHNGSNSMNLAKILVDVDNDLGIVVTTNFPEQKADAAAAEVVEALYRGYAGR
jgi:CubicO group peptidase (beta-lactamase class C family)